MKILKFLILFAALSALAAAWMFLSGSSAAAQYRTETIARGSIADVVTASGTINPLELLTVGAQVSGQVEHVYVKVNDKIKKGQLLADIDPSLLVTQLRQDQSALETAKSTFMQADRDLKRTRALFAKDYVAKVDLEKAEEAYQQAQNAYDAAKIVVERDQVNLSYAKITSPIDGVIISQDVTFGQTLATSFQTPSLFKIAGNLTQMKIDVNLSESDIVRVKAGMPVTFTVTAYPDREFKGVVQSVNLSPNTQQTVVMYSVGVLADNADLLLLPGMTAYVSMTISEKKDVLRVTAAAFRFKPSPKPPSFAEQLFSGSTAQKSEPEDNGDDKTIYLLKGGQSVPVIVKTGATDDTFVEISGDKIAEGDKVIIGMQTTGNR